MIFNANGEMEGEDWDGSTWKISGNKIIVTTIENGNTYVEEWEIIELTSSKLVYVEKETYNTNEYYNRLVFVRVQ